MRWNNLCHLPSDCFKAFFFFLHTPHRVVPHRIIEWHSSAPLSLDVNVFCLFMYWRVVCYVSLWTAALMNSDRCDFLPSLFPELKSCFSAELHFRHTQCLCTVSNFNVNQMDFYGSRCSCHCLIPNDVYLCDLQHLIKNAFYLIFSSMVLTPVCLRLVRKKLPDICTPQWQHCNTC